MTVMTYAEALNEAHRIAMNDDPNVFAIGQDIGSYGGYYGVTAGLLETFGKERILDTPISEIAISGASVGAALVGARPILEVGFVDFVGTCWDQIFNQAAKFCYMSGGRARVPIVIRMACGAGLAYGVLLLASACGSPGLLSILGDNLPVVRLGACNARVRTDDVWAEVEDAIMILAGRRWRTRWHAVRRHLNGAADALATDGLDQGSLVRRQGPRARMHFAALPRFTSMTWSSLFSLPRFGMHSDWLRECPRT